MKQTIEIEVPEGKKAIWKDGKIILEDIAPELPETWEEFCRFYPVKEKEVFIGASCCFSDNEGKRNPSSDKNMLPSEKAAKAHLALMQLHQLRDRYRQGWVPDWNNGMSNKYCITFLTNKYTVHMYNNSRCFLSFQSMEIAEKFLKNFKDLIKQADDLI